jgi:hypothetical protein
MVCVSFDDKPIIGWSDVKDTIYKLLFAELKSPDLLAKVHEGIRTRGRIWGSSDPELLKTKILFAIYYEAFTQDWSSAADMWREIYQVQIRQQPKDRLPEFDLVLASHLSSLVRLGNEQDLEELKREFPDIHWQLIEEEVKRHLAEMAEKAEEKEWDSDKVIKLY